VVCKGDGCPGLAVSYSFWCPGESGRLPLSFPTSVSCVTSVLCGGMGKAAARDRAKVGWHLLATWTPSLLDFDSHAAGWQHGCLAFVEDSSLHLITAFM